jgi:transcriptional regulator with PAS, ATPase and Fis domain
MSTVVSMSDASDHAAAYGPADRDARAWRIERLLDDVRFSGSPVGRSPAWRDVLRRAIQVAATDTTTCLQGESGVGKEVVARFIHRASPRRLGPFVAINCAALPESLFGSELFGFERGAFTGAHLAKPGQIEMAAGGVLFLDEVSEMTPAAQAKFLGVLQEREFRRLGGLQAIRANVRLIAATNQDLYEAVARGQLRLDLYYRLNVFDIRIPRLRERREDIVILARAFLQERARLTGGARVELTAAATDTLLGHEWPGNVRELHNALERATIVCEDGLIRAQDLSLAPPPRVSAMVDSTELNVVERQAIERAMRNVSGNKVKAALFPVTEVRPRRHRGVKVGLHAPGCVAETTRDAPMHSFRALPVRDEAPHHHHRRIEWIWCLDRAGVGPSRARFTRACVTSAASSKPLSRRRSESIFSGRT